MIVQSLSPKHNTCELQSFLGIKKSSYYYKPVLPKDESLIEKAVQDAFVDGKGCYGRLKIKKNLEKKEIFLSTRKIGKIMNKYKLVSKYRLYHRPPRPKPAKENEKAENLVNRNFSSSVPYQVILSDTLYFLINKVWHYLCPILDLCRRKIIGSAVSKSKNAQLAKDALYSIKIDLRKVKIFHKDRGCEFNNAEITKIVEAFEISNSFSGKGNPIDNAPCESLVHIIRVEFLFGNEFKDLDDFKKKWADYVYWYNNERLHSSLDFQPPEYMEVKC